MKLILFLLFLKSRVNGLQGIWHFLKKYYFYQKYKSVLVERYGKGSWVVITGGSQGIGRNLAIQLSMLGFNICIISNDEVAHQEIKHLQLKTQILTIEADFRYYKDEDIC